MNVTIYREDGSSYIHEIRIPRAIDTGGIRPFRVNGKIVLEITSGDGVFKGMFLCVVKGRFIEKPVAGIGLTQQDAVKDWCVLTNQNYNHIIPQVLFHSDVTLPEEYKCWTSPFVRSNPRKLPDLV